MSILPNVVARTDEATLVPAQRVKRVSLRSFVIGLLLVPLNVIWITEAEFYHQLALSMIPVYPTAIFILALLLGLNWFLRRLRPSSAFSAWELLVIYIMLTISCTITSQDFSINLGAIITSAGLPVNFPHLAVTDTGSGLDSLRPWLMVSDQHALQSFFRGRTSLYQVGAWRVWLSPVLVWSGFILVLLGGLFAVGYLFQRRWREELRLPFPVAQVPLSICPANTRGTSKWSGKKLLPGIAVSFILATLQGLQKNYPSVPAINTGVHFFIFPNFPWNVLSIWPTAYCFFPFAIGLAYFVPTNVLLSCWVFHLVSLATRVGENYWLLNVSENNTFYLLDERLMGGLACDGSLSRL